MFFLLPLQLKKVNTGERSGDRHSSVASGGTIGKVWRRDVGPSSPAASYDSSSEECRELCRGLQCQINREREAAIAGPSQSLSGKPGRWNRLDRSLARRSQKSVHNTCHSSVQGHLPWEPAGDPQGTGSCSNRSRKQQQATG